MRKPSLCALCGKSLSREDSSKEHVFPSSWYPDTTPDKVQRWTIRTHKACNRIYGDESAELRTLLATALGPGKIKSSGVWESVFRSINPQSAKDTQEKEYRQRAQDRWMEAIREVEGIPHEGVIPGIGEQEFVIAVGGKVAVVNVPPKLLPTVAEKIIRCVLYKLESRVIADGELNLNAALYQSKLEELHKKMATL